jgi:TRAP-type C4-dicarboxylate transport system permease small subunit
MNYILIFVLTILFIWFGWYWSKKLTREGKAAPLLPIEERTKLETQCKVNITILDISQAMGDYKVFLNGNRMGSIFITYNSKNFTFEVN